MAQIERKRVEQADETRVFDGKGQIELVHIGAGAVGRATFQPGWRWSEHVGPTVGSDTCDAYHLSYVISGRQRVVMNDGTEMEFGPGDVAFVSPGHDGWVVGDEPCVLVDFAGMLNAPNPG